MKSPLVSIIIPSYNAKETIQATLESCTKQTHSNLEILVIDDQSEDNSSDLVGNLSCRDSRIVLFENPVKGAQNARNLGLDHAQGEFIKFMDADDLMDLDLIEKQVLLLRDSPVSVVKSNWAKFSDDLSSKRPENQPCDKAYSNTADFLADLWNGHMYPPHAWLVPKSLIAQDLKWNDNLVQNQDGEFFARVVSRARDIKHCDATVYYRQPIGEDQNISQRAGEEAIKSQIKTLQTYKTIVDGFQPHLAVMRAYNQQVFNVAYRASNSVSEGKYLDDVLSLMTHERTSEINISSTTLRFMAMTLGVKRSLHIRHQMCCGLKHSV